MNRDTAVHLLDRLHRAQNAFYDGGTDARLEELLAPAITWTVPGQNRIAGIYRGPEEVLAYFRRRRDIAARTLHLQCRDVLVGEGDRLGALVDGVATIGGIDRHWSTVGLYDVLGGRIAACWLLPLDPRAFDEMWT